MTEATQDTFGLVGKAPFKNEADFVTFLEEKNTSEQVKQEKQTKLEELLFGSENLSDFLNKGTEKKEKSRLSTHGKEFARKLFFATVHEVNGEIRQDQEKLNEVLLLLDGLPSSFKGETSLVKKSLQMRSHLLEKGRLSVNFTELGGNPEEVFQNFDWQTCCETQTVERTYTRMGKKGKERAKEIFALFVSGGGVDEFGNLVQEKVDALLEKMTSEMVLLKGRDDSQENRTQLEFLTLLKRSLEMQIRVFKKEEYVQELRTSNSSGVPLVNALVAYEKQHKPTLNEAIIKTYTETRLVGLVKQLDARAEVFSRQIIGGSQEDQAWNAKQLFFRRHLLQKWLGDLESHFSESPQTFLTALSEKNYDQLASLVTPSREQQAVTDMVRERILVELGWELKEYRSSEQSFRITPFNIDQAAKSFEQKFLEKTAQGQTQENIFDNIVELLGEATGRDQSKEEIRRALSGVLEQNPQINIYGHDIDFRVFLEKFLEVNSEKASLRSLLTDTEKQTFLALETQERGLKSKENIQAEELVESFLETQRVLGCSEAEALEILFHEPWFMKLPVFADLKSSLEKKRDAARYKDAVSRHDESGVLGWAGGFLEDVFGKRFGLGKKGQKLDRKLSRKLKKVEGITDEDIAGFKHDRLQKPLSEAQEKKMKKLGVFELREEIFSGLERDFKQNNGRKLLKYINAIRLFSMFTPTALQLGEYAGGVGFWSKTLDGILDPVDNFEEEGSESVFIEEITGPDSLSGAAPRFEEEATSQTVEEPATLMDQNYDLELEAMHGFELLDKVEQSFTVRAKEGAQMLVVPLKKDLFVNTEKPIRELALEGGDVFEIEEVRVIRDAAGNIFQVGVVSGNYGSESLALLVLDSGSSQLETSNLNYATEVTGVVSAVSYIVDAEKIYPNKVINDLQALLKIAQYQQANGPFAPGKDYSMVEMMALDDSLRDYEYGRMSSGSVVRAGGVCSIATGVSSLLYETFSDFRSNEQWQHPERYFQGPFSNNETLVDATVEVGSDYVYDFSWNHPGENPLYLHFNVSLVPNGNSGADEFGQSDVDVVVSMSFSENPPGQDQVEYMEKLMNEYEKFREGETSIWSDNDFSTQNWDEEAGNFVDMVYGFEDLSAFSQENEALLTDVLELKDVLNTIPDDQEISEYLKETEWYYDWVERHGSSEELDSAIKMLDFADYTEGQRVQCVGFSILLAAAYPELNIQHIGGAPVKYARELVPDTVVSGAKTTEVPQYGGVALGQREIEDFSPGDLFVLTNSHTGHVGAILGETTINGETVLLVADANRHEDGQINIFTVNSENFFEVFGEEVNIIRSSENARALASASG